MDILSLLIKDHEHVKHLLSTLEDTTNRAEKTRTELFKQLDSSLTLHEQIEETLLYPLLKEKKKTHTLTMEAYEEHHVADLVVGELIDTEVTDDVWLAKLTVLKENIFHHIKEEEEKLFPLTRQVIDKKELEILGGKMKEMQLEAKQNFL